MPLPDKPWRRTPSSLHSASGSGAAATAFAAAIALMPRLSAAQPPPEGVPTYTTWQPGWTSYHYDRAHVVLGVVAGFTPYRLTVAHRDGATQLIDLKPGTAIFPTGQTPTEGEHVAVIGYWSKGTFIASRVILRPQPLPCVAFMASSER